jgi:hypothetical protein
MEPGWAGRSIKTPFQRLDVTARWLALQFAGAISFPESTQNYGDRWRRRAFTGRLDGRPAFSSAAAG